MAPIGGCVGLLREAGRRPAGTGSGGLAAKRRARRSRRSRLARRLPGAGQDAQRAESLHRRRRDLPNRGGAGDRHVRPGPGRVLLRDGRAAPPPVRRSRGSHVSAGAGRGAEAEGRGDAAGVGHDLAGARRVLRGRDVADAAAGDPIVAREGRAGECPHRALFPGAGTPPDRDPLLRAGRTGRCHLGEYWLLLGQANQVAGHVDAAIDAYEQVLALKPDNAAAQKALDELRGDSP